MSDDLLIQYALRMVGVPYRWSGDNPVEGFDCSGFCCELLKASGLIGWKEDLTAHGIYERLKEMGADVLLSPEAGAYVFFGAANRIRHVGFCVDNFRMIEAGGGNSNTINLNEAKKQDAFVRLRPVNGRNDIFRILKPVAR